LGSMLIWISDELEEKVRQRIKKEIGDKHGAISIWFEKKLRKLVEEG